MTMHETDQMDHHNNHRERGHLTEAYIPKSQSITKLSCRKVKVMFSKGETVSHEDIFSSLALIMARCFGTLN